MRKWRTLIEGPEWQKCRAATGLPVETFDEVLRFAAANIACDPKTNTTAFLDEGHRIMRISLPNVFEVWVFFRIEPDDESCTLLWMESRGVRIG